MKILGQAEVHASAIEALGLDPSLLDLTCIEAIACALRRAASFLCPCPPRTLISAVWEPLKGLASDQESLREDVEEALDALVCHGDLLELAAGTRESLDKDVRLLFAAPPAFVQRKSSALLILGVSPDSVSPLPEEYERKIDHHHHVRVLDLGEAEDARGLLEALGFINLSMSKWTRGPGRETAAEHLAGMQAALLSAHKLHEILGLRILDPTKRVTYYRGRWVEPKNHTGCFIARRPQAYGADLWCYAELKDGDPERILDLPVREGTGRGCDVAWRLQAAIDHERGVPQRFKVRRERHGVCYLDVFSPVPMWARRRWVAVGEEVSAQRCLFSIALPEAEVDEEIAFAQEELWLAEIDNEA